MISVVDDDPSVRRSLRRLLRSLKYDVEVFASAQEFLDFSFPEPLECLILDVHIGGMNGFELQQKLLDEGRTPPVIFITAHDDEPTRERVRKSGAIAYVRKPFDEQTLIDALDKSRLHKN